MSTGLLPSSLVLRSSESESESRMLYRCWYSQLDYYPLRWFSDHPNPNPKAECSIGAGTVTMSTGLLPSSLVLRSSKSESPTGLCPTPSRQSRPGLLPQQKWPGTPPQPLLGSAPQHHSVQRSPRSHPEGVYSSCNFLAPSRPGHLLAFSFTTSPSGKLSIFPTSLNFLGDRLFRPAGRIPLPDRRAPTLGGPPTVSPRPSRSESPAQPDPSVPAPTEPGPASLGYPIRVFLRDGSPMAEKLACLKINRAMLMPHLQLPHRLASPNRRNTLPSAGVSHSLVPDDPGG